MVAPRSIAAALGLLAFSSSVFAGLWTGNPIDVILSRSIWAMVLFAVIGLLVGIAAGVVVREHVALEEARMLASEEKTDADKELAQNQKTSTHAGAEPMGT